MTARELEDAAEDLTARRRRANEALLLAAICAVAAACTAPLMLIAGISLATGAGLGALVAAMHVLARREAVARLALEPGAYTIQEVNLYGSRFAQPAERAKLAGWLREIVREASMPQLSWCFAERVTRYAQQLESLAADLMLLRAPICPASAVACHRLLTRSAESPLYNPAIPAQELDATIRWIRRGVSQADP